MRRTVRTGREEWVWIALAWALVLILAFIPTPFHRLGDASSTFVLLPALISPGRMALEAALARVEVDSEGVTIRSLRLRRGRTLTVEELARYHPHEGEWYFVVKGRTTRVPVEPPYAVHAAMAELLPKKLAAKRLRMKNLPPSEEFLDLPVFDFRRPAPGPAAIAALCVVYVALYRTGVGAVGALLALGVVLAVELSARLDVTTERLVRRGLLGATQIAWGEATAIFCEKPKKGRRSFVITAPGRAIHVPVHLARDLETIRKIFCSLPVDTPCVNFDPTTFRGYRRRKRRKAIGGVRREPLVPLLTDWNPLGDGKA